MSSSPVPIPLRLPPPLAQALQPDGTWLTVLTRSNDYPPAANNGPYCYQGYGAALQGMPQCMSGPTQDYALQLPAHSRNLRLHVTEATKNSPHARGIILLSGAPHPPARVAPNKSFNRRPDSAVSNV